MKIGTYFSLFKPLRTQKFKKKFPNFFGFLADFLALKFCHFCPFGLALGHVFLPKVCWAKPWPCLKPIRSHPMQHTGALYYALLFNEQLDQSYARNLWWYLAWKNINCVMRCNSSINLETLYVVTGTIVRHVLDLTK